MIVAAYKRILGLRALSTWDLSRSVPLPSIRTRSRWRMAKRASVLTRTRGGWPRGMLWYGGVSSAGRSICGWSLGRRTAQIFSPRRWWGRRLCGIGARCCRCSSRSGKRNGSRPGPRRRKKVRFDDREASGGCQNGSIGLSLSPSCDARNGLLSVPGTGEKSRKWKMEKGSRLHGLGTTVLEDLVLRGRLLEP